MYGQGVGLSIQDLPDQDMPTAPPEEMEEGSRITELELRIESLKSGFLRDRGLVPDDFTVASLQPLYQRVQPESEVQAS